MIVTYTIAVYSDVMRDQAKIIRDMLDEVFGQVPEPDRSRMIAVTLATAAQACDGINIDAPKKLIVAGGATGHMRRVLEGWK